jgi:hypothetical protein
MLRVMNKNAELPVILATMARRDLSDFERRVLKGHRGFKGCMCVLITIYEPKGCLRQCFLPPSTKHQIITFLRGKWCCVPPIEFQKLVESMPRRLEAVLAVCGGPTPY